jgi:DNA repair exonuclease SbcCD nuclease subunit
MRIALITDTHAGIRNDNPAFQDYQSKCWRWFFDYIDEHNIKTVIHLGDIFDKKRNVSILTAHRLRNDFVVPLLDRGIETHIICGNHDQYHKNTHEVNAIDELLTERYPNIHTYSMPTIINVGGLDIQILPWITNSNYDVSIEAITNPKAEIVMGHLELIGFTMQRGAIAEHGMLLELFENFDRVFSGHYHHRSSIGNVSYIGAFGEYTWIDYDDPRGFSVFDTETRKIEFIQNPYKMFRIIRYSDVDVTLEDVKVFPYNDYANAYVKLLIVNKDDQYLYDMFFDRLFKAEPLDIIVIEDSAAIISGEVDELDEAEDTPTLINSYIDQLTMDVSKTKMKRFMTNVYKEALEVE